SRLVPVLSNALPRPSRRPGRRHFLPLNFRPPPTTSATAVVKYPSSPEPSDGDFDLSRQAFSVPTLSCHKPGAPAHRTLTASSSPPGHPTIPLADARRESLHLRHFFKPVSSALFGTGSKRTHQTTCSPG